MSDGGTTNAFKMSKILSLKKQWNTSNNRGPLGNDNDLGTLIIMMITITMILITNNN